MTTKNNITYWSIFGTITAAAIAYILYLVIRPFSHKVEDGIEDAPQNDNNMLTPNYQYNLAVRGYRNNNPLNIRISSNNWKGEIKPSQDKSFAQFTTMAYGFRAAMVCIRTYQTKHGCKTLQEIINRWAPWADGNNPVSYANHIVRRFPETFPNSNVEISYTNRDQMTKLVYAMAIVENGSEPNMYDCMTAYGLM